MAATWRVINQRRYEVLTPAGTFVPVWEITYETIPGGTVGQVEIPERLRTPEYVAAEIDREVSITAAIESMGNG